MRAGLLFLLKLAPTSLSAVGSKMQFKTAAAMMLAMRSTLVLEPPNLNFEEILISLPDAMPRNET